MSRSDMLLIGSGGCGNNQLNEILNRSKRYNGLFFNTNMREMEILNNFDKDRMCFYIPSADGTGKDRDLTDRYITEERAKFAETISGFRNVDYVTILSSTNGGTGSKAATKFPRMTRQVMAVKGVNLISTFPSLDESYIDFNNTLDYWDELIDAMDEGFIDNVSFIDNNKCKESEINEKLASGLEDLFNMAKKGNLDNSDLAHYFEAKGYNLSFKLNSEIHNIKDAIVKAMDDSIFYPLDLDEFDKKIHCEACLAVINTNNHNIEELKKTVLSPFKKIKEVSEGDSFIALGGCDLPVYPRDIIRDALRDLKLQKSRKRRMDLQDLKVGSIIDDKEDKIIGDSKKNKTKAKSNLLSDDFDNIFNDDLWK